MTRFDSALPETDHPLCRPEGPSRQRLARPRRTLARARTLTQALGAIALAAFASSGVALAEPAKGTLVATGKTPATVNVKFAYLVKGPDSMSGKQIRQLILSEADQGAHIKGCATLSCATEKLGAGMTVDFDAGPRLLYWFVANGQKVQASGTADPSTITLSNNTAQRVSGKWTHDASGQGGPRIAVEFDAMMVKEFAKAR